MNEVKISERLKKTSEGAWIGLRVGANGGAVRRGVSEDGSSSIESR